MSTLAMFVGLLVLGPPKTAVSPGMECVLSKPIQVRPEDKGRGPKVRLPKGSRVDVVEVDSLWLYVRADNEEGWVREPLLKKKCSPLQAAPPESAPPTDVQEAPASAQASAPTEAGAVIEGLQFGEAAGSGPMVPEAPEGSERCTYGDDEGCDTQCRLGHAESCFLGGEGGRARFASGKVSPEQMRRVAAYYTRAYNRGYAEACVRLGEMYELGEGLPVDDRVVRRLYERACGGGAALGCTRLGYITFIGAGKKSDPAQAAVLYRRGCELGSPQGCTDLGILYQTGAGVELNEARAAELFRQGCEGDPYLGAAGCARLGFLYEVGRGVGRDVPQAVGWYQQGCFGRATYACDRLAALGELVPEPMPLVSSPAPSPEPGEPAQAVSETSSP